MSKYYMVGCWKQGRLLYSSSLPHIGLMNVETLVNFNVFPIYKNREKRMFEFGDRLNPPHWPHTMKNHYIRVKDLNCQNLWEKGQQKLPENTTFLKASVTGLSCKDFSWKNYFLCRQSDAPATSKNQRTMIYKIDMRLLWIVMPSIISWVIIFTAFNRKQCHRQKVTSYHYLFSSLHICLAHFVSF